MNFKTALTSLFLVAGLASPAAFAKGAVHSKAKHQVTKVGVTKQAPQAPAAIGKKSAKKKTAARRPAPVKKSRAHARTKTKTKGRMVKSRGKTMKRQQASRRKSKNQRVGKIQRPKNFGQDVHFGKASKLKRS